MKKLRRWAALFSLAAIAFLCAYDLPDRLAAERNGASEAIVVGYHKESHARRPWRVEARKADGEVIRGSEYWSFRWLEVGEATQFTQNRRTYVGSFWLRLSLYVIVLPLLLLVAGWDWFSHREK